MTTKEFIQILANGKEDLIQLLLDILKETQTPYCVIGGLGVNAYVEPVVSLDLDIVVIAGNINTLCEKAAKFGLTIESFEHSVNISSPKSDIRIQFQMDDRYQTFVDRAIQKSVLGYEMNVAGLEDILQGKIWAYSDPNRRKSKRQKDLTDILRLVENYPDLKVRLPLSMQKLVEQ